MTKLRISPDLSLPEDAVTQTFGILAVRGAGKTHTAMVLAEEMGKAGLPFVVIDPVGVWWGLRTAKDGKRAGLSIPVLGGSHGDVPLEKGGGQLVADLVVDERLSCVLDVSGWEAEAHRKEFLLAFAKRLYHRNTEPLHLFLEEADDYLPQKPMRDETQLLRAWENIVRRGRSRGLGVTLISQRSAAINKNVLTQVETLVVLRTTSMNDRKAIQGWVDYHAQDRTLVESLPALPTGTAWFWSPQWLGLVKQVRIRERETFDSSATPELGKARRAATVADVDLQAIAKAMAETIERAKATDPKELQREVARLRRELQTRPADVREVVKEVQVEVPVEVPILTDDDRVAIKELLRGIEQFEGRVSQLLALDTVTARAPRPRVERPVRPERVTAPRVAPKRADPVVDGDLSDYARGLLNAVAKRHPVKVTRSQVALFAGRSPKSSMFGPALAELLRGGYLAQEGHRYGLTEYGEQETDATHLLPDTPAELQAFWLSKLPDYESSLLARLIEDDGAWVTFEDLSERSGRSLTSSMFMPSIRNLVELELADRDGNMVRTSEALC